MKFNSKILYVDDDKENLTGFEISLSRSFGIETAENSQVAYSILQSSDDIGVVLVDYKMPKEDGISFVDRIKDEFPDLIFIITSAWADMDVVIKAMNMNCFYGFIQKPWNYDELTITLKNALEHFEVKRDNKRLNAELLQQNEALEVAIRREKEANRVKNVFLQNISHEIRTPLNSIIGFSNLIKQNLPSDTKVAAYSDLVIQGGYELLRTIHNILESALIFSNQVVVSSTPFDIKAMVNRLVGEAVDRVAKKNLTLQCKGIDEVVIVNDELKVQYILRVLLDNAIKFTSKGSISISVLDGSEISDDEVVLVRVSDTGMGIDKKDIDMIFQPFKQVDDSSTRQFGGSGIGLFIAKSYAELLGGRISVESEPNRGSVFSLILKKSLAC
ncbi:hybrid sensor histidine kinase/response regulator [Perlabentimonas gracilis]|uniref:hybrid sensor histidine kinase/response regulator n=1 Tax=Perlabentimonas gracilis TaxID=2715279 RepID=UPI00140E1BCC|nr:hybrid sensor histidine kinase/response regulator [Perlabentimonas gracilis]NHB67474.1 hybrid sensor histidine kinase/response regulator [Perlabentimonas gracilis]